MRSNLLKSARVAKGLSRKDMAAVIEKSVDTYAKKEQGKVVFSPAEISVIAKTLGLTFSEIDDIFFDSELQSCKTES